MNGAGHPAEDPQDDVDHQVEHLVVTAVDQNGYWREEDAEDALDDLLGGPSAAASLRACEEALQWGLLLAVQGEAAGCRDATRFSELLGERTA